MLGVIDSRIVAGDVDAPRLALDAAVLRLSAGLGLPVAMIAWLRVSSLTTAHGDLHASIAGHGGALACHRIPGAAAAALVRWLKVRSTVRPATGHEDFVFIGPHSGRRVTSRQLRARLRDLGRAAGLDMGARTALAQERSVGAP